MAFVQAPKTQNRILAGAIESEQGVDASPGITDPGTDVINTHTELNFIQFQADRIQVPTSVGSMTLLKDIIGAKQRPVGFQKHLNFDGSADSTVLAPDWIKCVRTCGYSCTSGDDGSSSSWILVPRSDNFETMSFMEHASDIRKKSLGAIGTFSIDFPARNPANFNFQYVGENVAPAEVTFPTSSDRPKNVVRQVESASLTIGGWTPIAPSIRFDSGGANAARDDVNSPDGLYAFFYSGRNPEVEITMEVPLLSARNFYTDVVDAGDIPLAWQVGSNALGYKTVWSVPTAQAVPYDYGDRNGGRMLTARYAARSDTPNGEVTITHYEKIA